MKIFTIYIILCEKFQIIQIQLKIQISLTMYYVLRLIKKRLMNPMEIIINQIYYIHVKDFLLFLTKKDQLQIQFELQLVIVENWWKNLMNCSKKIVH